METDKLTISTMKIKDLESIKDILEYDFDSFWSYSVFKCELENPNSIYFVLKLKSEIVGFVGLLMIFDEADITNIVIKKQYRGFRIF